MLNLLLKMGNNCGCDFDGDGVELLFDKVRFIINLRIRFRTASFKIV